VIARSRSSRRVIVAHAHDRAINGHRSDTRMRRPTVYKPRRAPPTIGRPVVLLPMAEGATAAFGRAKGAPAPLSGGWAEQHRHAVRNNIVTTEKREQKVLELKHENSSKGRVLIHCQIQDLGIVRFSLLPPRW
jgi:hypothetical protein